MDDLLDLNSNVPSNENPRSRNLTPKYYPPLQPTPPKGSDTTPASDSFANLVSFGGTKVSKSLSLQEQQQAAQEARLKQAEGRAKAFDRHFGQANGHDWESLGSERNTPANVVPHAAFGLPQANGSTQITATQTGFGSSSKAGSPAAIASERTHQSNNFNDLLGFDDNKSQPASAALVAERVNQTKVNSLGEEDDVFGLDSQGKGQQTKSIVTAHSRTAGDEDDDFLGALARPVSEFPAKVEVDEATSGAKASEEVPQDRSLAELVDMGFPVEKAKEALTRTPSGMDVQAAVGWLLSQAHKEAKSKGNISARNSSTEEASSAGKEPRSQSARPAWIQDQISSKPTSGRQSSRSPVNGERDTANVAAEIGSNLFRTANSLWKTGASKLNKAVAELNNEADPTQPKWMRTTVTEAGRTTRSTERSFSQETPSIAQRGKQQDQGTGVTDEALMLESGDSRPTTRGSSRRTSKPAERTKPTPFADGSSPTNSNPEPDVTRPKFLQQIQSNDPRSRARHRNLDEQSAHAYVSPARRRKPIQKPSSPEPNLLVNSPQKQAEPARQVTPSVSTPQPVSAPSQIHSLPSQRHIAKPPAPKRSVPSISPSTLSTYTRFHQTGNAAVKRGDYAAASNHYNPALSSLPAQHPLRIITLSNRAFTNYKTGEPKAAVADADAALELIGQTRGVGEHIDAGAEGVKDMHIFWGKAMVRKAEALEQLEKWKDAGTVWKSCVEAGVGGATSIAGRTRCEKAVNPTPRPVRRSSAKRPLPKPTPRASATDDLGGRPSASRASDSAAVQQLRAANVEAERVDDEKFRLADAVSDRVDSWRKGKEANLRALLASLENVLWENSGWKKVGMGELIVANKVKIVYMKGIAKVHPDKLPQTATTEQKMISAAVFATLNEAWDRFKKENGL